MVNDPAGRTDAAVRRTYDRAQLERAWLGGSGGMAYVIHDAAHPLPAGHPDQLVTRRCAQRALTGQPTSKLISSQPVAPSGSTSAYAAGLHLAAPCWSPGPAHGGARERREGPRHWTQESSVGEAATSAACHGPPSTATSTPSMPVCWSQAEPARTTSPESPAATWRRTPARRCARPS